MKVSILSLLFLCIGFTFTTELSAQHEGASWMKKAKIYADSLQYDSAIIYYDSAAQFFVGRKQLQLVYEARMNQSKYLDLNGQIDSAAVVSEQLIAQIDTLLPSLLKRQEGIDLYSLRAAQFQKLGLSDTVLRYQEKLLTLKGTLYGKKSKKLLHDYLDLAATFIDLHRLNEADSILLLAKKYYPYKKSDVNSLLDTRIYPLILERYMKVLNFNVVDATNKDWEALKKSIQKNTTIDSLDIRTEHQEVIRAYAIGEFSNGGSKLKELLDKIRPYKDSLSKVYIDLQLLSAKGYEEAGMYQEGVDAALEAQKYALKLYTSNHPSWIPIYARLASLYTAKSDYFQAELYARKGERIALSRRSLEHPDRALAYFALASVWLEIGNIDSARIAAEQSYTIRKNIYGMEHLETTQALHLLGNILKETSEKEVSKDYLTLAMRTYMSILPNKNHVYLARVFNDLGVVYQTLHVDEEAILDYVKSLEIYESLLGKVHPYLAQGYFNVGWLYENQKNFLKAAQFYHRSLQSNYKEATDSSLWVNPEVTMAPMSDIIALRSMSRKAESLENYWKNIQKEGQEQTVASLLPLNTALDAYVRITRLIDKLRTGYVSEESKLFLSEKTSYLYEKGILLSLQLYDITQNKSYKEVALTFSERSKAGILLSSLTEAKAKKLSGVPDSFLEFEREILENISLADKALLEEMQKGTKALPAKVNQLKDKLFYLREEYAAYLKRLETEYERYYQLKYDTRLMGIDEIQKGILWLDSLEGINKKPKKNVLVEYFVGTDQVYIFKITADTYTVEAVPHLQKLKNYVSGFRNSVIFKNDAAYLIAAQELYKLLISPIKTTNVEERWIIIPHGVLSYLPFEALLASNDITKNKEGIVDYRKLPYFRNSVEISYFYSAILFFDGIYNKLPSEQKGVLTWAPVFQAPDVKEKKPLMRHHQKEQSTLLQQDHTVDSKWEYAALPATALEAEAIFKAFQKKKQSGIYLSYQYATEGALKSQDAQSFRFLHFATHCILNEERPEFSGIALSSGGNEEDGLMHTGEVFSLNLKAELVTLSGCESGLGKIVDGEGLIGLSRGFLYAGAQNILASLWKVADSSTADLMKTFYQKMLSSKDGGKNKARALKQAQRRLIRSKDFSHPYFWAPFLLIGY